MKARLMRMFLAVSVGWLVVSVVGLLFVFATAQMTPPAEKRQLPEDPDKVAEMIGGGSRAMELDLVPPDELMAGLVYRTYPKRGSQYWEELLIRDFFDDQRGGFFVDVGSSHYKIRSTTHYIDKALGWEGLAIDAIAELAVGYEEHRPRTKFIGAFVGETSDEDVDFHVFVHNTRLSSAAPQVIDALKHRASVTRKLKTVSLTDLLDANQVKRIDLLKMDIELWEPAALRGFDIDRFKPRLVILELHDPVREEILTYMSAHDYVALERYMEWDMNGWFVPREELADFQARKARDPIWRNHAKTGQ